MDLNLIGNGFDLYHGLPSSYYYGCYLLEKYKDIRIRPRCSEAFVMRGSYHILTNQLKIGWHIDFYERLKHLLVERI